MSLRVKCAILLIAFELTIAATLFVTVRVIQNYFQDAARTIADSSRSSNELRRLRRLLRDEHSLLRQLGSFSKSEANLDRIAIDIQSIVENVRSDDALTLLFERDEDRSQAMAVLENLLLQRQKEIQTEKQKKATATAPHANFEGTAHLELDRLLGRWESDVFDRLSATAQQSFAAFYQSVLVLSINMIVGAVLGVVGLLLVRRWVLLPVIELTHAADEFGRGNLDYRANVGAGDELGQLAQSINHMAGDIDRLNRQMVYRERAAAMGELISYIAHNIRNPLAGIRSLSESCHRNADDAATIGKHHSEIIASVERLQRWLREIEHVSRPLEVRPQAASATDIVNAVVEAFRPMAIRKGIDLHANLPPPDADRITVDAAHFEQALAAVVGNAIEASDEGGAVTVSVTKQEQDRIDVISISDTGPGIADDMRSSVFQPAVSSKSEGSGLGLAMARRVAALHGGELSFECPSTGGTIFHFTLPNTNRQD